VDTLLRPFDAETSLLLAVESATPAVSVALVRGGQVLGESAVAGARHHAETLLPMVDALLTKAQVGLEDLDAFAVSIGPGTFTSLRIALSTIKGLAFGSDRPVAAVSTLAAVACSAGEGDDDDLPCVALLDARRDEYYAGAFAGRAPFAALPDALPESLYTREQLEAGLPKGFRLAGEGAEALGQHLRAAGRSLPEGACLEVAPQARAVAALGAAALARGEGQDVALLVPRYLRRAQAEEDRVRKQGG
jgi:tRNA threonylcarbamoyladenosine biosynthesis protein TsaB